MAPDLAAPDLAGPDLPAIGVAGAGRIGRGIALAFAYAGYQVVLIDLKHRDAAGAQALADSALIEIGRDLDFLAGVGVLDPADLAEVAGLVRVVGAAGAPSAISACDVIFEGVPETIDAKQDCFAILSAHARPGCVIASTTSTIGADMLAAFVTGPERFCNAHWLNPAHLMPLVEISPCAATAPETIRNLRALLTAIGKVPIVCKSSPGYIVPRIQALAMNEAARLVEEGVASAEDIDTAVTVGFGLRFAVLGLLEFIDWGGGDILYNAGNFLAENIDPARFAPPAIVRANMAQGRRGLRDGAGFYDYTNTDLAAYRTARLSAFVGLLQHRGLMPRRG
jgi:3-hydroxybutyryl-CoA dehydrogenase